MAIASCRSTRPRTRNPAQTLPVSATQRAAPSPVHTSSALLLLTFAMRAARSNRRGHIEQAAEGGAPGRRVSTSDLQNRRDLAHDGSEIADNGGDGPSEILGAGCAAERTGTVQGPAAGLAQWRHPGGLPLRVARIAARACTAQCPTAITARLG